MAAMMRGCVIDSRSLLPRKSVRQSANRSPRNCCSLSAWRWIMVPMAPSRITSRSCSSARKAPADSLDGPTVTSRNWGTSRTSRHLLRFGLCLGQVGPQPQGVTDRIGQLGTIQGVEMELLDPVPAQVLHLFYRHIRGNHAPRLRIVIQPIEALTQPRRHGGAAALGKAQQLGKARDRQYSRHQARANSGGLAPIAVTQENIRIEEELRNRPAGTRIHLAFQVLQIGIDAAGFGMPFRIGRDR